ncbi:alpha/beta-hydrolase [Hymenopellis radicata]|nr:alpha/beta-hydrolase [Hymenopellis radicata]
MRSWIPALLAFHYALATPSVKIANGTLHGLHLEAFEQDIFLGIPFAEPPVDNLRYRNPKVWNQAFSDEGWDATSYGWSCPQYGAFLWIYGGGFSGGSTSSPVYNLSYIVQESIEMDEPIIAVSMNYRLATFGFLASAQVVESGNANLGFKDQRLALRWIQENIAYFGGDPSKVTIWGESAGAYSVGAQVLAYGGKDGETGLFRGAIYESGTAVGLRYDVEHTQASYDDIVNQTGCASSVDTLDCLRAAPYDVLYTAGEAYALRYTFGPVVDGDFIPDFPSKLLQTGQFDTNAIGLVGANTDEGTATFFGWEGIDTDEQFYALLTNSTLNGRNISADTASKLVEFYPNDPGLGSPYGTGDGGVNFTEHGLQYKRSASFAGDMYIIAPRRYQCEVMKQWSSNVYSYRFNTRSELILTAVTGDILSGVNHYDDILFVFGNPTNLTDTYEMFLGSDPTALAVSKDMVRAWVSFTRNLNPNHVMSDLPYWPSYGESPVNMVFDAGGSYVEPDDFRKEGIALINTRPEEFLR